MDTITGDPLCVKVLEEGSGCSKITLEKGIF